MCDELENEPITFNSDSLSSDLSETKGNEKNTIDSIYAEMEEDRIHLDSLRLDKRFNKIDYDFISRLPLTAKQLINVLYELYPPRSFSSFSDNQKKTDALEKNNNNETTFVDLTESKE
jgi:hypothetical protein